MVYERTYLGGKAQQEEMQACFLGGRETLGI